jgi:hypothetical protein
MATNPVLTLVSVAAAALIAPVLLVLWSRRGWSYHSPWPALVVALSFGYLHLRAAHANVMAPDEWDFACFWLYGHVAAAGLNVYDPAMFHAFAAPFHPDRTFVQAVLDVGFPYPPPSIFLFLPLGHVHDVGGTGLGLWYAVQFAALLAAALVLQRAALPDDGPAAALLILALTLLLPALAVNTHFAQTNSLCLLFVALAFAGRSSTWGAAWPVLATWVKPYAAALLLADVARWRVRRLGIACATVALSLIAALAVLGPKTMLSYVVSGPVGREPAFAYGETASLLGVIVRAAGDGHLAAPAVRPLYLTLAALLAAATLYLCARAPSGDPLAFCLTLLLGLLVYPATLEAYGVVQVVPILVLWTLRERLPWSTLGASIIIALTILLQRHLQAGFPPNALLWACCAYAMIAAPHARLATGDRPVVADRNANRL